MDIAVNYKNNRRYKTAKYPIRQPKIIVWLIWLLSRISLIGIKYKVEKINMEGLKPPYMLLSNHMHFIDFKLTALATFPHRVNNVVSIDGYYRRPPLMELIGSIGTRKYIMDLHLIKSINKVLKRGDILCMYPEARYSPCGIQSYLPESLGKLVKMNKVPVVTVLHRGNHLYSPFWNWRNKRKAEHHTTLTQILTAEQVKSMTVSEINEAITKALTYDDYRYQKEAGIRIKEPYRAEGLHKVLYQCPHCGAESKMDSKGDELFCTACGKRWTWHEDGTIEAQNGETEFAHIPDWFNWERQQVIEQIHNGTYHFEDEVEVYGFPRCWRFIPLGKGKVTHDIDNGWTLEGEYRGEQYRIHRMPTQQFALHVEYDYCYIKPEDCFDLSNETDSFYCYPTKKNVITKLAFATDELHRMKMAETKSGVAAAKK